MRGDAELVALGVGQGCPLDIPLVFVVHHGGAEAHEPFDFGSAIVGLEVKVNAVLDLLAFWHRINIIKAAASVSMRRCSNHCRPISR
jgi:hypothetical protein